MPIWLNVRHLEGIQIGASTDQAVQKLSNKLRIAGAYGQVLEARTGLAPELSVWSSRVPKALEARWGEVEDRAGHSAQLIANGRYAERVREVATAASRHTTITGNDFYRALQLLTHLSQPVLADLPQRTARAVREVAEVVAMPAEAGILTWAEVVKIHRTQRGIRAPRGGAEASIICNMSVDAPYPDRFIGPDVLRYVGQGFDGDQEMTRDNESLRQAIERGVPIRVFEHVAKNQFRDHGMWFGEGEPEHHLEPSSGRRLVVFTLRLAG